MALTLYLDLKKMSISGIQSPGMKHQMKIFMNFFVPEDALLLLTFQLHFSIKE